MGGEMIRKVGRPTRAGWSASAMPALLLMLACASTPADRIEDQQALFDTYPSDVQQKIREGLVAPGFDEAMVRMALGDPDETSTEVDESGETLRWAYTKSQPGVSIGLGGGGYGGGTAMGGGVGIGSGPQKDYLAIVDFRDGKVVKARYFDQD
jgi:hypothetical protein